MVMQWIYRDIRPIAAQYWKALGKPSVCAFAMALALWRFNDLSLFLLIPAGAGVYTLLAILTGAVDREDRGYMRAILSAPVKAVNETVRPFS